MEKLFLYNCTFAFTTVSYTHLDVYKRQVFMHSTKLSVSSVMRRTHSGSAHHKMRPPILKGSHEPFLPAQVQRRFLGTGLILPQITWTARSEDEDLS